MEFIILYPISPNVDDASTVKGKMLAAAKYIGAGLLLNKYIKEMKSITLYSSIYATAFIIYFLYTHLFDLYLIENNYLLLTFSGGLIVSSQSDKPKLKRLTKEEQKQYIIPENLQQILVVFSSSVDELKTPQPHFFPYKKMGMRPSVVALPRPPVMSPALAGVMT